MIVDSSEDRQTNVFFKGTEEVIRFQYLCNSCICEVKYLAYAVGTFYQLGKYNSTSDGIGIELLRMVGSQDAHLTNYARLFFDF